ncbi:hypothetical protein GCM10020331_088370 [Ectobacillus funiculus]
MTEPFGVDGFYRNNFVEATSAANSDSCYSYIDKIKYIYIDKKIKFR